MELLTYNEVAELMRCSRRVLYDMLEHDLLPRPLRFGPKDGIIRWRRRELLDWLEAGVPRPVSKKWNWTPDQDRHAVEMQAVMACRQAVEGLRRGIEDLVEALTKEEVIM